MGGGTAGMASSYDKTAVRAMDNNTILEANEWLVYYAEELAVLGKALVDAMTRRMGRRIREDRNAYLLIM
jgi:acyl carrier protein phosphodiesterase